MHSVQHCICFHQLDKNPSMNTGNINGKSIFSTIINQSCYDPDFDLLIPKNKNKSSRCTISDCLLKIRQWRPEILQKQHQRVQREVACMHKYRNKTLFATDTHVAPSSSVLEAEIICPQWCQLVPNYSSCCWYLHVLRNAWTRKNWQYWYQITLHIVHNKTSFPLTLCTIQILLNDLLTYLTSTNKLFTIFYLKVITTII